MKCLFICNVYSQLLIAIKIRQMYCSNMQADLLLSDHSAGAENVAARLNDGNIFDNVKYIKTKHLLHGQNNTENMQDIINVFTNNVKRYKQYLPESMDYDYIFFYNPSFLIYMIYDGCIVNGKGVQCIRFEEGLASYNDMQLPINLKSQRMRWIENGRRLRKKPLFPEITKQYMGFYPDMMNTDRDLTKKVMPLSRNDHKYLTALNIAFHYEPSETNFNEKYIYFASSCDIDGMEVGESSIVLKLADVLGRENLLVKVHPRDKRTVYAEHGLHVMENSYIPWEIFQLNGDFSEHVFITLSSSSILNACAMLGDNIESYILYPCVRGKNREFDKRQQSVFEPALKALQRNGVCLRHRIIDNIKEIG